MIMLEVEGFRLGLVGWIMGLARLGLGLDGRIRGLDGLVLSNSILPQSFRFLINLLNCLQVDMRWPLHLWYVQYSSSLYQWGLK